MSSRCEKGSEVDLLSCVIMFRAYNVLIFWLLVLVMAYDQYSDYNLNLVKVLFFLSLNVSWNRLF
jgi:hypothetical protein